MYYIKLWCFRLKISGLFQIKTCEDFEQDFFFEQVGEGL